MRDARCRLLRAASATMRATPGISALQKRFAVLCLKVRICSRFKCTSEQSEGRYFRPAKARSPDKFDKISASLRVRVERLIADIVYDRFELFRNGRGANGPFAFEIFNARRDCLQRFFYPPTSPFGGFRVRGQTTRQHAKCTSCQIHHIFDIPFVAAECH